MNNTCLKLRIRFRNETSALRYFSTLLQKYPLYQLFFDKEIFNLFTCYEKYPEKTRGHKVIGFVKKINPRNKSKFVLYVVLDNGKEVDWSYRKAVKSLFDKHGLYIWRVKSAFRNAIASQIKMFKESRAVHRNGKLYVWTDSGELVPIGETDVHHVGKTFEELLYEFLSLKKLKLKDIPIKEAPDGIGNIIADKELMREWQEFHRKHAKLSIMKRELHKHLKKHRKKLL